MENPFELNLVAWPVKSCEYILSYLLSILNSFYKKIILITLVFKVIRYKSA
jgi:hypothetical protein